MAGVEGLEPPTPGFGDRCSNQLSYTPRAAPESRQGPAVFGVDSAAPGSDPTHRTAVFRRMRSGCKGGRADAQPAKTAGGRNDTVATPIRRPILLKYAPRHRKSEGGDTTMKDLRSIIDAAAGRINENSSLEEIEAAARIAQSIADAQKTEIELQNSRPQIRLEILKTLSALAIPAVSIVTLFFTILVQAYQLNTASRQSEDTQWREFLKDLRDEKTGVISDPTIVARLKSFLNSNYYQTSVKDVAKGIVGRLADRFLFEDIINVVFNGYDSISFVDAVDINRNLQKSQMSAIAECQTLSRTLTFPIDPGPIGICNLGLNNYDFLAATAALDDSKKRAADIARINMINLNIETSRTSALIAERLQNKNKITNNGSHSIDISNAYLLQADLSHIDFKDLNITGTQLESVNLKGAILSSFKGIPSIFGGSNWWDAERIDPNLLEMLVRVAFPGSPYNERVISDAPITRDEYEKRILALYKKINKPVDLQMLPWSASESVPWMPMK